MLRLKIRSSVLLMKRRKLLRKIIKLSGLARGALREMMGK